MRKWWWLLLLIPASVVAQQVQAFATDTIPAHLDSVVVRSRKDTTIQTLWQPQIIIWTTDYRNRQHIRDSLVVWCTRSCKWEWDGVVDMPDSGSASLSVTPVWGVDSIHAPAVWAMGYTGQGVKVASLDSGIDPNHPGYVVGGGYNAVTNESGTNFWDDIAPCNGHGTHVGGTLADRTGRGVAPGSLLFGLKVFENVNGQCLSYTSRQISALYYAINNNIRAVNISIGGVNGSIAYQEAIIAAWRAGIVVGAANGNSGTCPALMPGRADSLLGVASVNQSLQRSGFSNCGPTTDLSAPGEGIESTLPGGGYGQKSGTSMATPHVVGAAALVMSAEPTISGDSVMQLLRLSALPLGAQPNDYTGYGLVRPDRAIALARGGVWVAGPVQDTVRAFGEKCYPMVAVRPYAVGVTAGVSWRQAGDTVCVALDSLTPRNIQITALTTPMAVVQVDTLTRFQTMDMWETSLRMWEQDKINDRFASSIETYNVAVANYLVDSVGINGVRVQVQSGLENPVDYWAPFVAGTMSYTVWSPSRYEKVNDNANPNVANLAGFQFAPFDYQMEKFVLPMKARLAARGESLHVNLNYLDFKWNAARQGTLSHASNPAEFAEFVLVYFERMRDRYGITPDAFEVILEPENTLQWDGGAIGRGAVAVAARLAAAGFHPKFIVPSMTNMGNAVPTFNAVMAVPGTAGVISMLAYHRYGGESAANAQSIRTTAASRGVKTGMLEKVGAGIDELWEDLTVANVSAWQQWGMADESGHDDAGAYYARVNLGQAPSSAISMASRTPDLATVFRNVRRGAVRVGSVSSVPSMAFVHPGGWPVVIVRSAGGVIEVRGLRPGRYQVGNQAVTSTGTLLVVVPAGVVAIRGVP